MHGQSITKKSIVDGALAAAKMSPLAAAILAPIVRHRRLRASNISADCAFVTSTGHAVQHPTSYTSLVSARRSITARSHRMSDFGIRLNGVSCVTNLDEIMRWLICLGPFRSCKHHFGSPLYEATEAMARVDACLDSGVDCDDCRMLYDPIASKLTSLSPQLQIANLAVFGSKEKHGAGIGKLEGFCESSSIDLRVKSRLDSINRVRVSNDPKVVCVPPGSSSMIEFGPWSSPGFALRACFSIYSWNTESHQPTISRSA